MDINGFCRVVLRIKFKIYIFLRVFSAIYLICFQNILILILQNTLFFIILTLVYFKNYSN